MEKFGMRHRIWQRRWAKALVQVFLILGVVVFLCEYAMYPLVLYQCYWPSNPAEAETNDKVVKAMFVADTHLLGPFRGHWFDKLRREWQMHRSFQTAIGIFNPEVVFFLGDLFDEGEWVDGTDFDKYVARFEHLFAVPEHIDVQIVAGNHDIGFHYQGSPYKNTRFKKAFNTTSVRLFRLKGVNFVLINSMAMEMDDCFLCKEGFADLSEVKKLLFCQQNPASPKCISIDPSLKGGRYNYPILLQHFPMYRESDSLCSGPDSAPDDEKQQKFRPTLECLSADSTKVVLQQLKPRLVLSGHTHHYCLINHFVKGVGSVPEYSVPSFSWRNRNDPSFFLGHFSSKEFFLSKCLMPQESTANLLYLLGALLIASVFMRRVFIFFIRCIRFIIFRRA